MGMRNLPTLREFDRLRDRTIHTFIRKVKNQNGPVGNGAQSGKIMPTFYLPSLQTTCLRGWLHRTVGIMSSLIRDYSQESKIYSTASVVDPDL